MKALRRWSIRNAGWLKKCYPALEATLAHFNPLLKVIGYKRLDKPFARVGGAVRGFLFDSQSCGQCVTGGTGMTGAVDQKKEGGNLCIDLIEQVREIEGASGARIMACPMEDRIGEIVTRSDDPGGREPWRPTPKPIPLAKVDLLSLAINSHNFK